MKKIKVAFFRDDANPAQICKQMAKLTPNSDGKWGNITGVTNPANADYFIILNGELDSYKYTNSLKLYFQREPIAKGLIPYPLTGFYYRCTHDSLYHVAISTSFSDKSFTYIKLFQYTSRSKQLVSITSALALLPGHKLRTKLILSVLNRGVNIDVYGRGWKDERIKEFGQKSKSKFDLLSQYQYCLTCENSRQNNYWTEKFIDCILSLTMPIYWGCPNIHDYFPTDSYHLVGISNIPLAVSQILNIISTPPTIQQIRAMMIARDHILYRYNIWAVIESIFFERIVIAPRPPTNHNVNVVGMRRSGNHFICGLVVQSFKDKQVNWFDNLDSINLQKHMTPFHHITENDKRVNSRAISRKLRNDNPFLFPDETDCILEGYYDYDLEMLGKRRYSPLSGSNSQCTVLILRDLFNMCASRFLCSSKLGRVDLVGVDDHIKEVWKSYAREYLGETSFLGEVVPANYNLIVSEQFDNISLRNFIGLLGKDYSEMDRDSVMKFMGGSSFPNLNERNNESDGRERYNERYLQLPLSYLHVLSQWWKEDAELRRLHYAIFDFTPILEIDTGYYYHHSVKSLGPTLKTNEKCPIEMMTEADKFPKCVGFTSCGEYKKSFNPNGPFKRYTKCGAFDISKGTYVKEDVEPHRKFHSQYGQDRYCFNIFFRGRTTGVFVDVGASDGVTISNTLAFENRGFTGICIEPRKDEFDKLSKNRKCHCEQVGISANPSHRIEFTEIKGYGKDLSGITSEYNNTHRQRILNDSKHPKHISIDTIYIETVKLQDLLDKYGYNEIDFLSVDTEGSEFSVLQSIDWTRTRVNVIAIENNYQDRQINQFLLDKGFKQNTHRGVDDIYVHSTYMLSTVAELVK